MSANVQMIDFLHSMIAVIHNGLAAELDGSGLSEFGVQSSHILRNTNTRNEGPVVDQESADPGTIKGRDQGMDGCSMHY
jgi:hypothetical protein